MAKERGNFSGPTRSNNTHECKLSNVLSNMTLREYEELTGKDASWILTTAVIIFTMQTGKTSLLFFLLSPLNRTNRVLGFSYR